MQTSYRVPLSDKTIRAIVKAAYADYGGRKIFLCATETVNVENNFWSEGSREYYVFVRLVDLAVIEAPAQNPLRNPGEFSTPLPEGFVCVRRSISCGKHAGVTLLVNPANVVKLLPAAAVALISKVVELPAVVPAIACTECDKAITRPEDVIASGNGQSFEAHRFVPVCRNCARHHGWMTAANQFARIWPNGLGYDVPGIMGRTFSADWYQFAIAADGGRYRIHCAYFRTPDGDAAGKGEGDCPISALADCQRSIGANLTRNDIARWSIPGGAAPESRS